MRNKILTISIIFILLSFIFINTVSFGVDYESDHYIDIQSGNNVFRISANEDFYCIPEGGGSMKYWSPYSFATGERIYVTLYQNGVDSYGKEINKQVVGNKFDIGENIVLDSKGMVVLYKDSTKTDYFFQPTPLSLGQAMTKAEVLKTFQTMIRGMIPSLIVFLVGLVAFWKVWQLLLKELRKA